MTPKQKHLKELEEKLRQAHLNDKSHTERMSQ